MKILFLHQNMPGQYFHLAQYFSNDPRNEVIFVTQRSGAQLPGIRTIVYKPHRLVAQSTHHYIRETEGCVLNAQEVARIALDLKATGFTPDLIFGHNAWGEIWYLKDVFPRSFLIGYFEFFYKTHGADVGFNPEELVNFDTALRVRTKNIGNLLGLSVVDRGQCATWWQRSLYPAPYQPLLEVIHEGIDTRRARPECNAGILLSDQNIRFNAGDEIVTYVARSLEPVRGFPTFMRSLVTILKKRPLAHVLIVGNDDVSYGVQLPAGQTYKSQLLKELGSDLDLARIHFLGQIPYSSYLQILQVSRVHVYLTYPFVLSWSMLEAMSCGCLVVGSNTAPVQEVITHGVNGLLVDFFSPDEIAAHVVSALEDAHAHDSLRIAARQTVLDRYDLQNVCLPSQIKLIDRLLG